jgi:hypothetical protein
MLVLLSVSSVDCEFQMRSQVGIVREFALQDASKREKGSVDKMGEAFAQKSNLIHVGYPTPWRLEGRENRKRDQEARRDRRGECGGHERRVQWKSPN